VVINKKCLGVTTKDEQRSYKHIDRLASGFERVKVAFIRLKHLEEISARRLAVFKGNVDLQVECIGRAIVGDLFYEDAVIKITDLINQESLKTTKRISQTGNIRLDCETCQKLT
jgi:hypothetical protein